MRELIRRGFGRMDADEAPHAAFVLEFDEAGDLSEQGVVLAAAHVDAWLVLGAALADEDGAAAHELATEALHAQALALGIAPVDRGTAAFLVCHRSNLRV